MVLPWQPPRRRWEDPTFQLRPSFVTHCHRRHVSSLAGIIRERRAQEDPPSCRQFASVSTRRKKGGGQGYTQRLCLIRVSFSFSALAGLAPLRSRSLASFLLGASHAPNDPRTSVCHRTGEPARGALQGASMLLTRVGLLHTNYPPTARWGLSSGAEHVENEPY